MASLIAVVGAVAGYKSEISLCPAKTARANLALPTATTQPSVHGHQQLQTDFLRSLQHKSLA